MAKRIMSLFLAVLTLVSTFTLPAGAAPTLDAAMAEVDVYATDKFFKEDTIIFSNGYCV